MKLCEESTMVPRKNLHLCSPPLNQSRRDFRHNRYCRVFSTEATWDYSVQHAAFRLLVHTDSHYPWYFTVVRCCETVWVRSSGNHPILLTTSYFESSLSNSFYLFFLSFFQSRFLLRSVWHTAAQEAKPFKIASKQALELAARLGRPLSDGSMK